MEIEINNVKYRQREQPPKKPMGKAMTMLAMMAAISNPYSMYPPVKSWHREVPSVDIVKEFELIQQKKSNLPRSQRDWVVHQFNKLFEKV